MKLTFFAVVGVIVGTASGINLESARLDGDGNAKRSLDGLRDLVKRRIPNHSNSFTFNLVAGTGDVFTVSDAPGSSIHVDCTTISACARGLYTYLTQYGNVDIFWTGSRLDQLPARLPSIGSTPLKGSSIVPYRYHFNTVTFSYTTPFWSFDDWALLLDWLALRGVNLPLAWVGNEYFLVKVFSDIGLSDAEISAFLTGPAFQAWNRFGNIQGSWGGALPQQWINDQFALQKQIVARMVELGMTPVLPAFTGFIPPAVKTHFPNASIVTGSTWNNFPSPNTNDAFLDPFDPLFSRLQTAFITAQSEAYGNVSHVYTLDQYNENDPFSGDTGYLNNVSSNTFASLRAADPDAIWLMQAWLFFSDSGFWTTDRISAYLGGIPGVDSMLLLDLYTEAQPQWQRTSSYFGKPWVWCELHDYGGNQGLEGDLTAVTAGPIAALNTPGSSMKGMGLTMEGHEGNELVYNILLDQAWSATPLDTAAYVTKWVTRRYRLQQSNDAAQGAWSLLSSTIYNNTDGDTLATVKSILELTPSLSGLVGRTGHHPTKLFYATNDTIVPALKMLVQAGTASPALRKVEEYQNDIVDISRQLLVNRGLEAYEDLVTVFNNGANVTTLNTTSQQLLTILDDLDTLLMTSSYFLLSNWISSARALAHGNTTYANYLEYNARNQITLWGPDGEIIDYASKQWGGLVASYHKPRWEMFVEYLAEVRSAGGSYNDGTIKARLVSFGKTWDAEVTSGNGNSGTRGDTWSVVGSVVKKYT